MKNLFTLAATAALASAALGAQAQFTVDGTLSPTEIGTGVGKYQLLSTYTGTHNIADRVLKAIYMGTTATTLNIMVVASAEIDGYNSLVLYLDAPNKTGIAAGIKLPGSANDGNGGRESLRQRPTLDMQCDYAFRCTTNPIQTQPGDTYLSRVDYTIASPGAAGYPEIGMGKGTKDGIVVMDANDPGKVKTAYKTSGPTGSVTANTSTGWEIEIPLKAIGGAAVGSNFNAMVAYIDDFKSFNADVLPTITGQTAALGIDPDFTKIAGNQFVTFQSTAAGGLATRSATAALQASAYPNPLAADSRLAYTVAGTRQPVSVEVYNSLGQKAMSLLSDSQTAGRHEVNLAPVQKLAAGPYLVTLRVGNQLSSHRVMVQ